MEKVLATIEFDTSPIPNGVMRRMDEVTVKRDGCVWRIHKNDADPYPSNPHAHTASLSSAGDSPAAWICFCRGVSVSIQLFASARLGKYLSMTLPPVNFRPSRTLQPFECFPTATPYARSAMGCFLRVCFEVLMIQEKTGYY